MEKDLTQKGQFLRCLIWLGGGLTPNETLSHSNGKFVFDHGPKFYFGEEYITFDILVDWMTFFQSGILKLKI